MKWLKFYFRCFVIACISFKQNSWNGNYFSKVGGGVSVFTGMNQPYEWNEKYARHLFSRLCILQANTGMRTNKFDSALPLIFNYLCITQSIRGSVRFASSNLVCVWFITMCSYARWHHMQQESQAFALSFRVRGVLTPQCDLSRQNPHGQNKQMLILSYLCMVFASYPNKSS